MTNYFMMMMMTTTTIAIAITIIVMMMMMMVVMMMIIIIIIIIIIKIIIIITLRRDIMLSAVYKAIPEISPFALQAYSAPSVLRFGHLLLTSEMGPQQRAPLGPLLFSLPLQPVLQTLTSEL